MKICFKCKLEKDFEHFYKNPKNGYIGTCKECIKLYKIQYRKDNIEKFKEYDKVRCRLPHRKLAIKLLRKTEEGKKLHHEYDLRYRLKYKEKNKAHRMLNNYVRDGKIIRKPCQVCGNEKSQGHHEDYSKPLDVIWLCAKHHTELHTKKV